MEKIENWIKIAAGINEISFAENKIATIKIADKTICIAKINEDLKAFSSQCPHAGGNLSGGFMDKKGNIICPVHGYRFSMNTGRDSGCEGYFLKIYKIEQRDEGIFIRL
ncbi:MAG: Rieske 2Fe-2S domain-containing protein [Ginsengibacter sp.]